LTRASITFAKKSLRSWMDCRVKPGNDTLISAADFVGASGD
jgi:hypothetical protein